MKKIYYLITALLISTAVYSQANDVPCGATLLTLDIPASDDNTAATSEAVPAVPSCWVAGNTNTLWYQVVCPAGGQLKIKTYPLSSATALQNTQIALYSGTCDALVLVTCNDNAPVCGTYVQINSEITATGLVAGNTYWVRVDGNANLVGQYQILAINGTNSFPTVTGQDCAVPFTLCNATTYVGNPGFQVIGGKCDHNGVNNCTAGEANSVWYTLNIGTSGSLLFDIVPNDYLTTNPLTGQNNSATWTTVGSETDYDFVLWKIAGTGATTCALIQSSGGNSAVKCNWDARGVTGLSSNGNAPSQYSGFNLSYESAQPVVAGEQYVLVIQNYANSNQGFTLQFPPTTPVTFNQSAVTWTGGANTTNWNASWNWGGCNVPSCTGVALDATISSGSSSQPVLTSGTYSLRNLNICAGATLTLNSGATLQVCGNFINNGNLNCLPGSTIEFINGSAQNVSGSLTGGNSFYNLTINKTSQSVLLANNIDVAGNLTISNGTSILNSGDKYVKVGGNFSNFNGNTTFSGIGTAGTLEFNGTGNQNYNQGTSQLDLNFVVMNNSGSGVTLLSDMFVKTTTGTINFLKGPLTTNAFRLDVENSATASVSTGNATSYIVGNLWRTVLSSGGSYNFPLGTGVLWERVNVNLTGTNTYNRLQARFDPWPGSPNTQGGTECTATYSLPSENMGFWTINQTGSNTGAYNMTIYPNGATNTTGANGWTIQKAPDVAGPWTLNGTCAASTVGVVNRNGMSGFSVFAAAQSPTPLPVQLVEFSGYGNGNANYLTWRTESETNNSHFVLRKSADAFSYSDIERLQGAGNSNTEKNYSAVDENPFGVSYYILRQVDFNGEFAEFGPIAITNSNVDEFTVYNVYPNPAKGAFFVDVFSKNEMIAGVFVYDAFGKLIHERQTIINGLTILEIQSAGWASGIYTIKIANEAHGYQFNKRVVIGK